MTVRDYYEVLGAVKDDKVLLTNNIVFVNIALQHLAWTSVLARVFNWRAIK